jgi:hypothetical protein
LPNQNIKLKDITYSNFNTFKKPYRIKCNIMHQKSGGMIVSMLIVAVLALSIGLYVNLSNVDSQTILESFTNTSDYGYLSDDLVGHWKFDEDSGNTAYDSSGNDFHGTVYGATWTPGYIGGGLEFNGIDAYVQVSDVSSAPPSVLASLGEGSISVWFNVDHIPIDKGIRPIFYYGAYNPCIDMFDAANQGLVIEAGHSPVHRKSKRVYFTIFADGCDFPSFCFDSRDDLNEDEWYHFVAVVGEDYNTGYLNGEELVHRRYNFGTSSYSQFFADAVKHETLWIGKGYWDAEPVYFDGVIDDIRIYNRPLNAAEVRNLYGNMPPRRPILSGSSFGEIGEEYACTFNAQDPEGDDIFYYIDWGDGKIEEWIGPYPSGENVIVSHYWEHSGIYTVRAKARDTNGLESEWSNPFPIIMPKEKSIQQRFFTILENHPFLFRLVRRGLN